MAPLRHTYEYEHCKNEAILRSSKSLKKIHMIPNIKFFASLMMTTTVKFNDQKKISFFGQTMNVDLTQIVVVLYFIYRNERNEEIKFDYVYFFV